MAVTLSLFAGAGAQFFDNNGNVLSGGKIYTYQAGTTTPLAVYTSNAESAFHTNPIILDSAGRVPSGGEIWLQFGIGYKFVLKTSTEVLIATYDNIPSSAQPPAANDADSIMYEQGYTVTAGSFVVGKIYRIASVGTTDFTLIGATNNTVGTHFIATGVGTGTGTAELSQTVETKLRQAISVKDFGAVGDGATNDTAAIQAAIDYAETVGAVIEVPVGTYSVSVLTVNDGIGGINCVGVIKGQGTASVATIVLGFAGNPVTNASFTLRMDQSAGDLRAVQGYDTVGCTFTKCVMYGFVNSATLNHYAFWMEGPCTGNVWSDNHITLYDTPTQRGFGIALYGTVGTGLPYGGFFDGVVSRAQFPAVGNTITGNVIVDGSYAVSVQAGEYNTITGNYCNNHDHRSIYFANASWGNTVSGNVLRNFLSSAVVLGYGSSNNVVTGNYCESSAVYVSGEAAINITSGSQGNLIEANKINSATHYGVYVSTDSINTTVIGNDISNYYLAAIAVENDFESPRPTNANYSRPNYEAPPAPYTAWSYINLTGVVIQNNTIRAGYPGRSTAAIYIAQITAAGATNVSNITVAGNNVVSNDNIAYNIFLFEQSPGNLVDVRLMNNNFNTGNTEISASTLTTSAVWNTKISYFGNNKQLDVDLVAEEIVFADGGTTPSVSQNSGVANSILFQCANSSATSITNFTDQFENQEITVRLDANTTIVYGSGTIRTKGSVNIVGSSTNQLVAFKRVGSIWLETWRNF
jgi:hypothetical protein